MSEDTNTDDTAADDTGPSTADRIASENNARVERQTAEPAKAEPATAEKPAGYLPVDLDTANPQQVKERIDYLFSQIKNSERIGKENTKSLNEYRALAAQQSAVINELTSNMGVVAEHLHGKNVAESENAVRERMQAAFEAGDVKAYLAEQEKLIEIKADQKFAKKQAPPPKNETRQMANAGVKMGNAHDVAQDAMEGGELTRDDVTHVKAWQDESDSTGNLLRPWAHTEDPSDPDPDYVKALLISKKVWEKNPNMTTQEKLAEVDKKMGVQSRQGGQNVMGGNLTRGQNKSKVTLSPELQKLAVRTKFGGSKAKTDADHIEAYRKQVEKVQSSRGSR